METIRRNRTECERGLDLTSPHPADVAAYDIYGPELPELHEDMCGFITRVSQALREHRPAGVEAVVAYTPVS